MPKMKTHSGSKKRFRRSGTGKIMRAKAYKSHILTKKSTKRKRGFRQEPMLAAACANMRPSWPPPTPRSSTPASPAVNPYLPL